MGEINSNYLAKSNGTTLEEHTADVLEAIIALQEIYKSRYPDDWWDALKYAAFLHDLGKIDTEFQLMIKREKHDSSIPHSLFSLFFIKPEHFPISKINSMQHLIISAIAFHHWREYFPELLLGSRAEEISDKAKGCIEDKYFWDERVGRLQNELKELAKKHNLNPEIIGLNTLFIDYLSYHSLGQAGILVPPYTLSFLPARLRKKSKQGDDTTRLQVFLSGNLMRADHFASLVEDNRNVFNISDIEINRFPSYSELANVLKSKFKTDYLWQEKFKDYTGENLVLIAPTGVGKTEFAYLWGQGKKNIIILPMRAAVNGIWDRTRNLWKDLPTCLEEDVALLHGDASLELYQGTDMNLESEIRPTMYMARQLSHPYIICTADQIVPAALQYPGYERIFATLMNSNLIIDEVQAYDPRASAIIVHLIRQNYLLGGKTLLMTATLPAFIRNEVLNYLEISEYGEQYIRLIEQSQFVDKAISTRHHIKLNTHYGLYEGCIEEMLMEAREGKKVLVVVNTKRTAIEIYKKINSSLTENDDIELILLHSGFTEEHRQEKIKEVYNNMANSKERSERPCIVVSTQIVEASLDLDADILFTDVAPADSLVQRMGRVYRRYAHYSGNNASEEPNVVIMIDVSYAKDNKEERVHKLAPGIGEMNSAESQAVYDLDLTLLSLLLLIAIANEEIEYNSSFVERLFTQNKWKSFFKKEPIKKEDDYKKRFKDLEKLLEHNSKSFVIDEVTKMNWVELCYQVLVDVYEKKFLYMGKYVNIFYETLDLLEQGYCTDRKRDAENLFRNVRNITAIPISMKDDFYNSVKDWFNKYQKDINYLNLTTEVLQRYTVSTHFWHKDRSAFPIDLSDLLDELNVEDTQRQKLKRWFDGLFLVSFDYSYELGLIEGE